LPAGLKVGSTWSSGSDCSVAQGDMTLKVHQQSSATVVGRGQTSVAGKAVEVWVVQRHETQKRTIGGTSVSSDVVSSELVAPQLGLVIERMTKGDVVQPDGSSSPVTVTERLEQLPA